MRILGPLELVVDEAPVKIGGPREHIVLAILALRANRVVSLQQLIDAVWGEDPPPTARGQIQSSVSVLRKLLRDAGMPQAIKTWPFGYQLDVTADNLDSERFSMQVSAAHQLSAAGKLAEAAATLCGALNLWRGLAADGIQSVPVRNAASVLDEARLTATEEWVRLELELGRHVELVGDLQALLTEHPWREGLYGLLMLALYRSGRQADALDVYRRARAILMEEVGIEPGQELRDLERAVLRNDPSLDLRATDEQETRQQTTIPRQLPSCPGDFVGRDSQIAEIKRFLSGRGTQLARFAVPVVAISGPGGVGKSTLAQRAAHEVGDQFPDGHIYVELCNSNVTESTSSLLARFLRALGVSGSMVPEKLAERTEMYRSRLASKRSLLVLDDVTSEQQVIPLLPGSPGCAVIVTSRTRLAIPGAHWIDLDTFDSEISMELLERIVGKDRVRAESHASAEVIRYCGGLPLALRIAGARLASRPYWQISTLARRLRNEVRRLDEFSHGGMELRSSIGLTYGSLPDPAKRLFRLFAMIKAPDFPGWVAATLLDTDLTEAENVLDHLVRAQMLTVSASSAGQVRYSFHELIRMYALECLASTDNEVEQREALQRMLSAWLTLVEKAHRKEYGGDFTILHGNAPRLQLPEWAHQDPIDNPMDWLASERTALMSAIRQAAAADLAELCWDIALTSVSLFEVRGYLDDWRETAETALDVSIRVGNRMGIAAMRYSRGSLHLFQKRLSEGEREFAAALEIFETDGETHGQALVLRHAALVDRWRGNFDSMLTKYAGALTKMRSVGDLIGQANILTSLAGFRVEEGEFDEARTLLSEAQELCRRASYRRGEAKVLGRFAELHLRTGQTGLARRAFDEVLHAVWEIGDQMGEAHALYGLGMVRRNEGRIDSAEATLAHALSISERVGDRLLEARARHALGEIAIARMNTTSAAFHLDHARSLFGELGSSLWLAKTYLLLSEVHEANKDRAQFDQDLDQAYELLSGINSKQAAQLLRQLNEIRSAHITDEAS